MSGANGSEALVEPTQERPGEFWDCPNCASTNAMDRADCWSCGGPRTPEMGDAPVSDRDGGEDDDELEFIGEITEEQVKAGLQNMSGGIATSQDIENAARAGEGLPPMEAAGLLDFGPFNSDNALKAIFEKQAEVRSLQADYDRKKEIAKDAKGELDIASKALVNIIESLKNRGDAPASSLSTSRCPWEREHPGQSCPICTAAQAEDLVPALESEVHPEHEGHATVAEAARVKNVLEPLADQLVKFNIFTESIELQQLSTDDLNALLAYVDEPTPMPPHLVTRCCVAAEPGSIMQVCQNCEKVLHTGTNSGTPYPVNALVGFDCDNGKMREALVETIKESAEAPTEATRTIKPRGSKKRAKKEPEQERARQADAGRKAAASTPKKGKAKAAKRAKGRK